MGNRCLEVPPTDPHVGRQVVAVRFGRVPRRARRAERFCVEAIFRTMAQCRSRLSTRFCRRSASPRASTVQAILLADLFPGREFEGSVASCRMLEETLDRLVDFHATKTADTIDDSIHDVLEAELDGAELKSRAEHCTQSAEHFRRAAEAVIAELALKPDRRSGETGLSDRPFSRLESWLRNARERIDSLDDIVRFNRLEERFAELQLQAVTEIAASWKDAGTHLAKCFERSYLSAVMAEAFRERPALTEFDGNTHQDIINRFRLLDRDLFQHNRALVAQAHWRRLPRGPGGGPNRRPAAGVREEAPPPPVTQADDRGRQCDPPDQAGLHDEPPIDSQVHSARIGSLRPCHLRRSQSGQAGRRDGRHTSGSTGGGRRRQQATPADKLLRPRG